MNAPAAALPLLFLGSLFAQAPLPVRGASVAWDAAFVFDGPDHEMHLKGKNLPIQLGNLPSIPGVTDYTFRTIESFLHQATNIAVSIKATAMTSYNDRFPVTFLASSNTYRVSVPDGTGWASLFIARDGLDVVGFYFENPLYPPMMRNVVYHELVTSDFVYSGSQLTSSNQIMAMDFAIPRILENRGQPDPGAYSCVNKFYFAVTAGCAADLNALHYFSQPVDAATVFEALYVNGAVSALDIKYTSGDLHLTSSDSVDALMMFEVGSPAPNGVGEKLRSGTTCCIFSTDGGPEELQVLATTQSGLTKVAPLRSPTGQVLIGGANAMVQGHAKGGCTEDPELPTTNRVFGEPTNDSYPVWPRMSFSLWRYKDDMTHDRLHGILSGWTGTTGTQAVELWMQTPSGVQQVGSLPILASNSGYYSFDVLAPNVPVGTECKFMVMTRPIPVNWNILPNCSITVGLEF